MSVSYATLSYGSAEEVADILNRGGNLSTGELQAALCNALTRIADLETTLRHTIERAKERT